ncbi:uncharacterized protein F4817DRAFT_316230 [Daldinia loculata]|uniref:uncharacterized protein n=1 Tax=Daldinia loculata TaxID=103429 RepID=UPI0020C46357|nr:uncharacterized protein F4817DRAFT_316230 [Daldinia loculata]KAI1647138.1 hypothetical protein F4817DRAFT_316230 [Daldinia loculata]
MSKRKMAQPDEFPAGISWADEPQKRTKPNATEDDIEMEDATSDHAEFESGEHKAVSDGMDIYRTNIAAAFPREMIEELGIPKLLARLWDSPTPSHFNDDLGVVYIVTNSTINRYEYFENPEELHIGKVKLEIEGTYNTAKAANSRVMEVFHDTYKAHGWDLNREMDRVEKNEYPKPGKVEWWIDSDGLLSLRAANGQSNELCRVRATKEQIKMQWRPREWQSDPSKIHGIRPATNNWHWFSSLDADW